MMSLTTETQRYRGGFEKQNFSSLRSLFLCGNKLCSAIPCKFLVSFLITLSVASCTNESCEKQIRSLDSLSGALNQKLSELKQVDTVILQKAISKYSNYRSFIQQNINDTVNKEEADHLQQFYTSGKNLVSFSENRKAILARGSLINSQLAKLITDAKQNSIEEDKLMQFAKDEKMQAEHLIRSSFGQQQLFSANLQEFKLSLNGVEALIRSRNNGQMPTVIKDSIPL
ncbi:MAG: hypothetical protein K0S32_2754 [Bacteroidetes bacterium]|jgi:hypothetical protein|nr:hypothetical protein [Bacteroidota bacterium]